MKYKPFMKHQFIIRKTLELNEILNFFVHVPTLFYIQSLLKATFANLMK